MYIYVSLDLIPLNGVSIIMKYLHHSERFAVKLISYHYNVVYTLYTCILHVLLCIHEPILFVLILGT